MYIIYHKQINIDSDDSSSIGQGSSPDKVIWWFELIWYDLTRWSRSMWIETRSGSQEGPNSGEAVIESSEVCTTQCKAVGRVALSCPPFLLCRYSCILQIYRLKTFLDVKILEEFAWFASSSQVLCCWQLWVVNLVTCLKLRSPEKMWQFLPMMSYCQDGFYPSDKLLYCHSETCLSMHGRTGLICKQIFEQLVWLGRMRRYGGLWWYHWVASVLRLSPATFTCESACTVPTVANSAAGGVCKEAGRLASGYQLGEPEVSSCFKLSRNMQV